MKQLTRIRLVNWHLFADTTITCQGTTYFIGVNGAGKSTILDAVQFALVGGQRDVKFNQAAMTGSRRTLSSYVRGELGTEGQRYLRGDCTGLVALEFANPDGTRFVHGALVDAYADNHSPDLAYFIVHNAELNDTWFFKAPGQLFETGGLRRHLEHFALPAGGQAQVFSRLEDYRANLLNRLGQLRDTFPAKIVKGVAFSPLTNIRDFVHNYLLDEALVDVKTLQEQLETLRHFETLVADIAARIAELDRIEEYDAERIANRRRRITNGFVKRRAEADTLLAGLKRRRLERDEADLGLKRAELARDGLGESLKLAQETLLQAQLALQTDRTAARQAELRAAIATAETDLAALCRREAELSAALAAELTAMRTLRDLLLTDGQPVPQELEAFIGESPTPPAPLPAKEGGASLPSPGRGGAGGEVASATGGVGGEVGQRSDLQSAICNLQSVLDSLGQTYADQRALLVEKVRGLREEGKRLQREIAQLRTGDRDASYEAAAPAAARLRRLLRAELSLGPDEVVYLCQALDVADEAWQDAVEGVLGAARFHLLVPPAHYDAAMRLYRARRFKDDLHGVGLPDGDRILAAARAGEIRRGGGDRLATEVQTDHRIAEPLQGTVRAYVDLLLGGTVKCETLEKLRDQRQAVTRECFVRRHFSTSHLDPRHYRRWFIGGRAIPRQIAEREARLAAVGDELAALAGQLASLEQRLSLTRDRVRRFIDLERGLPELARLPEAEAALAALGAELAGLDTRTIAALQAEAQRARVAADEVQTQLSQADRSIGDLQRLVHTLDRDVIPDLERAGAAADAAAHGFLLLADAGDMADEAEKEYTRRRERQALEIVLENATRYEDDHTKAEARSRDRLREAKQAYSLRYDFGYDSQEDAGRYTAERQRYVESELPEYEARVARQRGLAEQELVENFIHRLREQIEDARSQLDHLNTTLNKLRFGGERYEFITSPAPDLRRVYDMVMDSQAVLGASLFDSDFRRKYQEGWDLLFERLTIGADASPEPGRRDERVEELRRLQDYRNYLAYDIRIHYPNGDRALHSQISAKKSGGETTTPFYVAMAASFAQAYRLNQARPSDTIRLAIFDEAFGKMDTARTASALKFMVDTGLQVLLATPPDKAGGLLPHVDSVRTVVRQENHAFVLEIDKREVET
ncbi:MAG: hypothetical protein AUK03_13820 [Anaerolineae bacterium CG2_30_64_16]|nr:MAG: hypothetical protein AUK03_13820 [Anaerolineae bacterium CG2_30_64_16]